MGTSPKIGNGNWVGARIAGAVGGGGVTPALSKPVVSYADNGTATITNYDAAVTYTGVRDDASTFSIAASTFDWKDAGNVGRAVFVLAQRAGYTDATSLAHFTPEELLQWRSDFDGTAGTDIVGTDGWVGNDYWGPADSGSPSAPGTPSTGVFKLDGAGNLAQYASSNIACFTKDVIGNDYEIEAEIVVNGDPSLNNDGNLSFIGARDNGILPFLSGASGVRLQYDATGNYSVGNNIVGSGNYNIGRTAQTGDKVKLRVLGGRAYKYWNGMRDTDDIASNGIDVSGTAAKAKVSFVGSNTDGGLTWPFARFRSIEVHTVKSYTFMLNAAIAASIGSFTTQLRVDTSVLHADFFLVDDNGFQITPIVSNVAPTSPGIYDVSLVLPGTAAGKSAHLVARDSANPSHASIINVGTLPAWQAVAPVMTFNLQTPLANYSTTNLMHMFSLMEGDWADGATARSAVGMTDAGEITIMPAIPIRFIADFDWPDAGSEVLTTCVWEFNPGFTPSVSGTGVSIANIDSGAGTADVTFVAGVDNPILALTGPTGAIAGGKLISRIYPQAYTAPQKAKFYRPAGQTYYAPFAGYRSLFMLDAWPVVQRPIIDTVQSDDCLSWAIRNGGAAVPCPALMTDLGGAGKTITFNTGPTWTPYVIRTYYAALMAGCAPTAIVDLRSNNEGWNAGNPTYGNIKRSSPNFTAGTLALSEGDWVKGATSGYTMLVHTQRIKTGAVSSSDAAGYLVGTDPHAYDAFDHGDGTNGFIVGETLQKCDASGTVLDADIGTIAANSPQHIKHARRTRWLIDLIKAHPDYDPTRTKFSLEHFVNASWSQFEEMLDEEDLYLDISNTLEAPYGTNHLGDWADESKMTQAEKLTWVADPAANIAMLDAAFRADVDIVGTAHVDRRADLAAYNVSKGLDAEANLLGTYEVSPNGPGIFNWQSIKFNTGTRTPVIGDIYKGRTSGLMFRVTDDGTNVNYAATGGSPGGSDLAGYFKAILYHWMSGAVRYPTSGETFDRVDDSGSVLTSAVFKAADATNLNYAAIVGYCDYMRSPEFGATYAYYMTTYLTSGTHGLFCEGYGTTGSVGERNDVFAVWNKYGFWGDGPLDDPTAHPHAEIVAAIP